MRNRTKMRLGMVLLIVALTFGITGLADRDAEAICCEQCSAIHEGCLSGRFYPTCAGDPTCCAIKSESCFWSCTYC